VKVVKKQSSTPFKIAVWHYVRWRNFKTGEILDLAVEFEIIKKAGSWFSYGETKLGKDEML
jgi:recombination protein RecA